MDVQQELSGEASDGVPAEEEEEEEGEDSSEEDAEDSGGSDGHSDLECEAESEEEEEEEGERPEQEQRQTPSGRARGGGREAREAARAELPYTFEGDQLSGFLGFGLLPTRRRVGLAGAAVELGQGAPLDSGHGRPRPRLQAGKASLLHAPCGRCRPWRGVTRPQTGGGRTRLPLQSSPRCRETQDWAWGQRGPWEGLPVLRPGHRSV